MYKILIFLCVILSTTQAFSPQELSGNWFAQTQSNNNGTITVENEYLHLNADMTFSILLLVSVQKGDAYIKDLRIEGSGIWRNRDNTLVVYVKKVSVPFAKEVAGISQESLTNLADYFKARYENDHLKIIFIKSMTGKALTLINEKSQETSYQRQ